MPQDTANRIPFIIEGIPGCVELGEWPAMRGKWASHTGFQSFGGWQSAVNTDNAESIAIAAHATQAAYPFVVGAEHREHGWKDIDRDHYGRVSVRLPKWHGGPVAAALEEAGMALVDSHNDRYGFIEAISMDDARKALAPILSKGTRFCDETALASRLRQSISLVLLKQSQLALF